MTHRLCLSRTIGLIAVALAVAGTLASASAETPKAVRKACTSDARKLCPREKPDTPAMHYCMEAKARQFSRGCVRALEDAGMVPRGYLAKN